MQQKMHHFGGGGVGWKLWQGFYNSEIAAQLKHSDGERHRRESELYLQRTVQRGTQMGSLSASEAVRAARD